MIEAPKCTRGGGFRPHNFPAAGPEFMRAFATPNFIEDRGSPIDRLEAGLNVAPRRGWIVVDRKEDRARVVP